MDSDNNILTIGAVIYPGFEMLDLFGPLEMFSMLGQDKVRITMLAETISPVPAAMAQALDAGPKVLPDVSFADADAVDLLLVPGGFGTMPQLENPAMINFLKRSAQSAVTVCSVCTGSLLLARAGLLEGKQATTNKQFFALSALAQAQVDWQEKARWVEDGKLFTSSGVSAGMDMALAIIEKLYGEDIAQTVAVSTEYTWHRDADNDPFAEHLNEGARQLGLL